MFGLLILPKGMKKKPNSLSYSGKRTCAAPFFGRRGKPCVRSGCVCTVVIGGAFASNATPAVLVGGAHLRGATHIGTRHLFSLRRAHVTQMRLLRRLPRRLHGRFYCFVVLVRRYVFNWFCSVVLVRRYVFNCICSVVLVRRYVFNWFCSVVLVRRYVSVCISVVVGVQR